MNEPSFDQTSVKRRRHSPQLKRKVIEACLAKQASIPKIALAHGLNANMVHRWIRNAQNNKLPVASGFVALPIPAKNVAQASSAETIAVEIPFRNQSIKVNWPLSQTDRCLALLRELLQ